MQHCHAGEVQSIPAPGKLLNLHGVYWTAGHGTTYPVESEHSLMRIDLFPIPAVQQVAMVADDSAALQLPLVVEQVPRVIRQKPLDVLYGLVPFRLVLKVMLRRFLEERDMRRQSGRRNIREERFYCASVPQALRETVPALTEVANMKRSCVT